MSNICHSCDNEFERLSSHWARSSDCTHPKISAKQKEVLTGVLMGDGSVDRSSNNPRFSCSSVQKEYLEYLDSLFPIIGLGVKLHRTAEQCVERDIDSGFNKSAKEENYSDIYRWRTMCHPDIQQFSNWYNSGEKSFPKQLSLTPTILKHWYCCDGSYADGVRNVIEIGVSNEIDEKDKIKSMFQDSGLGEPSWNICKRAGNRDGMNGKIYFSSKSTDRLFDYMGEPLPGFEYKWKP